MKKKVLTIALAASLLAGSSLGTFSVSAAGVKDVLSVDYYASKYSDLKAAFDKDMNAYVTHFLNSGAKEGRSMNPILDVVAYRKAYQDLDAAFGDDWDAYVNHYLTVGIKERRTTGVLFDLVDYLEKNPDLQTAYGTDYVAVAQQYVTTGINEKRPGGQIEDEEEVEAQDDSTPVVETPTVVPPVNTTPTTPDTPKEPEPEPEPEPSDPTIGDVQATHVHTPVEKSYLVKTVEPTCEEAGYKEYRCAGYYDIEVDGYTRRVYCRETYTVSTPATGHTMNGNSNVYSVHPTCTTDGWLHYVCQKCNKEVNELIDALGHDPEEEKETETETKATLTCDRSLTHETSDKVGYVKTTTTVTTTCKRCEEVLSKETTTKYEDQYLNHTVRTYPNTLTTASCTHTGVSMGLCNACGAEVTNIIPLESHKKKTDTEVYGDACHIEKDVDGNDVVAPCHDIWTIVYCENKDCRVIITATRTANDQTCTDDGNGMCSVCKLPINRNVVDGDMEYKEGTQFNGSDGVVK